MLMLMLMLMMLLMMTMILMNETQDVEKIDNFASHRLMMISISPLEGC